MRIVGGIDQTASGAHAVLVPRHIVDRAHFAVIDKGAFLNVDHNQGGPAFDQLSGLFWLRRHLVQPFGR
jgi:hypothetical protein